MTTIFTSSDVTEENIQDCPVKSCRCAYCHTVREYGRVLTGHGSVASHRLNCGDERHNPENKARLILRETVSKEAFEEYVSRPGGYILRINGKSGLWYSCGRPPTDTLAGHFIHVHKKKDTPEFAWICYPPLDWHCPLAAIVRVYYHQLTYNEAGVWAHGRITLVNGATRMSIPTQFRDDTRSFAVHDQMWGRLVY